jgi:hypothetical protein
LEQELGAATWSYRSLELGAVGARELWLEPKRDPHGTQVSIFTFFSVCLFCLFLFAMFLWSCVAAQHSEEGNAGLQCSIYFCGVALQRNVAKKATLRYSTAFALVELRYSAT